MDTSDISPAYLDTELDAVIHDIEAADGELARSQDAAAASESLENDRRVRGYLRNVEARKTMDRMWESYRKARRAEQRTDYRIQQHNKGKAVRPYIRSVASRQNDETTYVFERRKECERRAAAYRKAAEASGTPVRVYTDLSSYSDDEREARKREQNAHSKREQRKRNKALAEGSVAAASDESLLQ